MINNISVNCITLIKKFEGFSSKPYKCPANKITIGYGSTFYLNGEKVTMKDRPISEEFATDLLTAVVMDFSKKVNNLITVELNQHQYDAIISFCYNIGIGAFNKSTLLKKINTYDFTGAFTEFGKWIKVNGKVCKGLVTRRKIEADHFAGHFSAIHAGVS